jgi:hypothetical protein
VTAGVTLGSRAPPLTSASGVGGGRPLRPGLPGQEPRGGSPPAPALHARWAQGDPHPGAAAAAALALAGGSGATSPRARPRRRRLRAPSCRRQNFEKRRTLIT